MNEPPAVVTEPFTIMLYGITSERVEPVALGRRRRRRAERHGRVARARSRASRAWCWTPTTLATIQPGEILVSRITAPSWGPVFSQIAAVVTDIGGMMSHAAIVCREYGLPAVTGTGTRDHRDPDRPADPRRRRRRDGDVAGVNDYAEVWAAARPYMRARKNDVHIPLSYGYAERLLERHPEADADVVLLGILLHDIGWAVVDQEAIYRDGFGPGMMESDVRIAHEKEGARLARAILEPLGYAAAAGRRGGGDHRRPRHAPARAVAQRRAGQGRRPAVALQRHRRRASRATGSG